MHLELTIEVELDGDYMPGTPPRPVGDGTWEPGEGGMMFNARVKWNGRDVTDLLNAEQMECAEDAWIEHYESNL